MMRHIEENARATTYFGYQESVFIRDVELVEVPERTAPSTIRFNALVRRTAML